jgi:hypothetical protein
MWDVQSKAAPQRYKPLRCVVKVKNRYERGR